MSDTFKGYKVKGALRLAITDHARALAQIEQEISFFRALLGVSVEAPDDKIYNQARELYRQLTDEKTQLVQNFIREWMIG